jgi:hypothetical protein
MQNGFRMGRLKLLLKQLNPWTWMNTEKLKAMSGLKLIKKEGK